MSHNDPTERYLEEATQLASHAHCRFCGSDLGPVDAMPPQCPADIAAAAVAIAKAMATVREETLEEAASQFEDMVIRRGIRPEFAAQAIRKAKEE